MMMIEAERVQCLDKVKVTIMNYLYLGKLPDEMKTDEELIEQVLKRADTMQIGNLVDYCWISLTDLLNLNNFLKIWNLAEEFDRMETCAKVVLFINRNFEKPSLQNIILDVTYDQMMNIVQSVGSSDTTVTFILNWAKKTGQRVKLKDALNAIQFKDLSRAFIVDIVRNNELVKQLEIRNVFISSMFERTSMEIVAVKHVSFAFVCQRYCLNRKKWFLLNVFEIPTHIPHGISPICLENGQLFLFSKAFSMYNPNTREWYPYPNTMNRLLFLSTWGKYVYAFGKDIFVRFNTQTNSWIKLATFELPSNCVPNDRWSLVARRDKVFLFIKMTTLTIYVYDNSLNKWNFQTERAVNLTPVRSFCFGSCCKCKFYFVNHFWYQNHLSVTIYDTDTNSWNDKQIYRTNKMQHRICYVNCDRNFILFSDKKYTTFTIMYLDSNTFERIHICISGLTDENFKVFLCT